MPPSPRQKAGREAEEQALEHLRQHGMTLLARNWLCKRGELDLVMLDGDTVVFVEVRYRLHSGWGGALASVDARKREKLVFAAQYFLLKESRWSQSPCRFDVVALEGTASQATRLNWIRNAFDS